MKKRYGDGILLLYTDTDSVIIEIQTESLHEDMLKLLQHYDTSNFTPDHPLYTDKNKKVLGKFKDEMGGKILPESLSLSGLYIVQYFRTA